MLLSLQRILTLAQDGYGVEAVGMLHVRGYLRLGQLAAQPHVHLKIRV